MEKERKEGDFKLKKTTPRKLIQKDEVTKVSMVDTPATTVVETEVTKVEIKIEEDPKVEIKTEEDDVVIIEEVVVEEVVIPVVKEVIVEQEKKNEIILPDGLDKLVTFMQETGGTVEDYVRLNTDYSKIDDIVLVTEYYKSSKPYLDSEDIQLLLEENFGVDEEVDEERDIKKKKVAFKEEIAKAKAYLDNVKNKYYEEIKLRPNASKEQNEANDFFNRYKKNEQESASRHEKFKTETKNLFTQDFKGFDFKIGEKQFRYNVQNAEVLAEKQSNINNFVGKFLDKDGNVNDQNNYHKALYSAMNSDKIAEHFYEQGKADATKEIISGSRNPSTVVRPATGEVFIGGLKVKAVSGVDSSKLRIKTKKFNE